jgi:hypothetical protein
MAQKGPLPFPLVRRRPRSPSALPADEALFLEDLVADLAVRAARLRHAVDGLPPPQVSSDVANQVRFWLDALQDLANAAQAVVAHVDDRPFARFFTLDGALATLLSRLHAWCAETGGALQRVLTRLRQAEPVLRAGPYPGLDASLASFEQIGERLRRSMQDVDPAAGEVRDAWPTIEQDVEQLIWTTEWLHLSLASEAHVS